MSEDIDRLRKKAEAWEKVADRAYRLVMVTMDRKNAWIDWADDESAAEVVIRKLNELESLITSKPDGSDLFCPCCSTKMNHMNYGIIRITKQFWICPNCKFEFDDTSIIKVIDAIRLMPSPIDKSMAEILNRREKVRSVIH